MNPVEILERACRLADESPIEYTSYRHMRDAVDSALTALRGPEPDWSEAPDGAIAHSYDRDGKGWWKLKTGAPSWSQRTLPLGTDWRLSLRRRPGSEESA